MSADPKASPPAPEAAQPAERTITPTATTETSSTATTPVASTSEDKLSTLSQKATEATTAAAARATEAGAAVQTAATQAAARAQQHGFYQGNFEEEVGQVVKSLGSFWGGFKARSASTFTSIKAEVDKNVAQLQNDVKQLQETKVEVGVKDKEEREKEQEEERRKKAEREAKEAEEAERAAASKEKGKGRALSEGEEGASPEPTSPTSAFFSRLTSTTSSLQQTLQGTLASTLQAAKANPALNNPAQLRAQLAENLRLSSARENLTLSLKQAETLAEEYLKKGGEMLRDAERTAEKWVEENVKVVPPEGVGASIAMGAWDAGELYSFSTSVPASEPAAPATGVAGEGGRTPRASLSSAAIAGSRKEALLRRLREDKELLLLDPAAEAETQQRRDEFANWVKEVWPTAQTTGREAEVGNVGGIRMALVPEHLTDEQFWQRYLFHKDMIEAAEKKRKALFEATEAEAAEEENFNWDDDDDEPTSAAPTTDPAAPVKAVSPTSSEPSSAPTPKPAAAQTTAASKSSAATSPRDSEESYDVVRGSTAAPTEESDSDSDWE